jgi:hypothetical protein
MASRYSWLKFFPSPAEVLTAQACRRLRDQPAPACNREERLPQPTILKEAQTLQERPTCEHCGTGMWLKQIEPDSDSHERRIFTCPVCKQAEAKVVKFR